MNETIHDRIETTVKERAKSVREAERMCGLADGTIRKLLQNREQLPNARTLDALSRGLGVATTWLLTGDGATPTTLPAVDVRPANLALVDVQDMPKDIPVLGTAAGSHTKGAFQISGGPIDYVRRPPGLTGARDVYGLYVEGSSMEPQFFPGDLVFVHPHRPPRAGDAVVVQSKFRSEEEIEATIGIYRRTTEKHVVIQKWNPIGDIEILRNGATVIHRIMRMNELYGV